jgi:hypothetical protein
MPISRYDKPAVQPVMDTYIPLPYAEMYNSLQNKQKEYDFLKETADKADNAIAALQAPEYIRASTDYAPNGGTVPNPQAGYLKQKQQELAAKKQEILASGIDFTTPEGKKMVSEYVRSASNFYNNQGRQIQQDSQNIIQHNKNYEDYLSKGVAYQGNAYAGDTNVDEFLKKGMGFSVTGLNPYQDRVDIVRKAIDPIKSQAKLVRDKNGIQTFQFNGVPIATLRNGRTIVEGVQKDRIVQALQGVYGSELSDNLDREAKSKVQYLLGKNSDKIYDKDGKVKNVEGVPATEYYYQKYLKDEYKKLEDYAVSVFESSKIDDTQTNKFLPKDFQVGGDLDPTRRDLARPLYMGEALTNNQEIPDYSKGKAPANNELEYNLKLLDENTKLLNSPLVFNANKSEVEKTRKSIEENISKLTGGKTAQEYYKLKEKAQSGNAIDTHKYWEMADPYYKQVTQAYAKDKKTTSLGMSDIKNIQQIATNNRQTVQANLNIPLSDEYQGDKLDKDVVSRAALNGAAVIRDATGKIITKDELRGLVTSEDDNTGTSANKNLTQLINSYQLPVGKQPGGYNVNLGGRNLFIEYSNPKAKNFSEGIQNTIGNIYDIDQPATKLIKTPPGFIQAGFAGELRARGFEPSTIGDVKFKTVRDDLNINNSKMVMTFLDNNQNQQSIEVPIFGEGSITELTKFTSPLTGSSRDMTSANLPKSKTPEYDNQEFE